MRQVNLSGDNTLAEGNYTLEVRTTDDCKNESRHQANQTQKIFLWTAAGHWNVTKDTDWDDTHSHCKPVTDSSSITEKSHELWINDDTAGVVFNFTVKVGEMKQFFTYSGVHSTTLKRTCF